MAGTAVYGTVCTVVREDGGREPSSYPIPTFEHLLLSETFNNFETIKANYQVLWLAFFNFY